jgi:hypothetical protein
MKNFFMWLCFAFTFGAQAQTVINRSYPVKAGQQVNFKFDYPVVKISTWEKNEISVMGKVSINSGENDSSFELEQKNVNGVIEISSHIKDMDKIPHRYTVIRNGKKTIYKSNEEYQDAQKGGDVQYTIQGIDIDIVLEVKVPAQIKTAINAIYGIVEVANFNAPLTVDDIYGGIDATLNTARVGRLQATTQYGTMYSNLDLKITDHTQRDFFNSITAEPGTGPTYTLTSAYGKIYLRKP